MNEESLFAAALKMPTAAERRAFLDQACAGDERLRQRLERLLAADERAHGILDHGQNAAAALGAYRPEAPLGAEQPFAGRYTLREKLGEGGMGEVWAADQHEPVPRRVALKVVRPGHASAGLLARFEAERQALALMSHPNVARVLDAGEADGRPFFVMELIEGVPITTYRDQANLGPRQRLELFIPVCEAVQHAHQKGIIHRDIKPSNVLVALCDGKPVPKVIDFGVAKATGPRLNANSVSTEVGTLVGTLEYLSPEQAELSNLDVDTRSDVYSLGVLLYELLTGTVPFSREQLQSVPFTEMLRIIKEVEPDRPSLRRKSHDNTSVSSFRELDWVVMKCLEKEPGRRYATAAELALDVRRYLDDEPVVACPPSMGYRLRKWFYRHRGVALAAGLLLLTLTVGIIASAWLAVRATLAERAADDERNKAIAQKERADEEAAIVRALNKFLQHDLLGQADIFSQPSGGDMRVRQLLDRASRRIDGKFQGQEKTEAAIRSTLGRAYWSVGEYELAEKHLERALALRKSRLGDDHEDTLVSMSGLAALLFTRGSYGRSEALAQAAWKGQCDRLGDDHPDTLLALLYLALLDGANGRHDAAEARYHQVIKGFRKHYGDKDRRTLMARYNLVILYNRRGKPEAERLAEEIVDGFRSTLGADDPGTLHAVHLLAGIHFRKRHYDKAEPLYVRVLEARRATLGPTHPDTLTTMTDLAFVYIERNRLGLAEPLLEEALKAGQAKPGPDHPLTLEALSGLGRLHTRRGKFEQAEPMLLRVVQARRKALGPDHPETLRSISNLGAHYQARRMYDKAEPLYRQAEAGARKKLGARDPYTQRYSHLLANVYNLQRKHSLAEPLLRECAELRREQAKAEPLPYAEAEGRLAWNLLKQKKFAQAETAARACLAIVDARQPDARTTFDAQTLLGDALIGQGKDEDAERLLLGWCAATRKRARENAKDSKLTLIRALERLVRFYNGWGKPEEAAKWRKELGAQGVGRL